MKRLGGVPATKRLISGLSPAVSCGTEAAVMWLPWASNGLMIALSALISLSFDQVWNSVRSVAPAAQGRAPRARASGIPVNLGIVFLSMLAGLCFSGLRVSP